MASNLHISSGRLKGRKLLGPPRGAMTRPITGLAKKSLFGMLAGWIDGSTVADLYCGTGTLGLEALSRGAGRCIFAESDRRVLQRLRRNIDELGLADRCDVWGGDITAGLARRLGEVRLDLAFLDPPYADARRWSWQQAGERLLAPLADHLADNGLVVLRLPDQADAPDRLAGLSAVRRRAYGDMRIVLMGRSDQLDEAEGPTPGADS